MVRAHVLLGLCLFSASAAAVKCPASGPGAVGCTCSQANPFDSQCNYTVAGAGYCQKAHDWAGSGKSTRAVQNGIKAGGGSDTATNTNGLGFCPGKECMGNSGDNTDPNCYCRCSWGAGGIKDGKPWYVKGVNIVGNSNGEDHFHNQCCKVSFTEGAVTKYGCIANTAWKDAQMNYQTQKFSTFTDIWPTTGYARVGAASTASFNGIVSGFEDRCRSCDPARSDCAGSSSGGTSSGGTSSGGSSSDAAAAAATKKDTVFDLNFTKAKCTADTTAKAAGGNGLSGVALIILIIFFALAGPVLFGARVYAKKGRFCTTRQTCLKLFIALTAFVGIIFSVVAVLFQMVAGGKDAGATTVTLCTAEYYVDNKAVHLGDAKLDFASEDCTKGFCKKCVDAGTSPGLLVVSILLPLCCGGVFLFTLCRFCTVKDGKAKCSGKADKILKAFTIICSGGGVLFGCLFVMMGSTCAQAFRDKVAIGENSISQSVFGGVFPILGAVFSAGTALFIVLGTSAGKLSCCCLVWDEKDGYVRMKGKSNAVKPDEGV